MIPSDLLRRASGLSSATLHEAAGRIGALPASIKPIDSKMRVCGPALPVRSPPGDNLWLHRAIYAAAPGDVLVIDCRGGSEFGYWGEVMARASQARQIAGLVISGGVRDSLKMAEIGFPVFSQGTCIRGTGKDPNGDGAVGASIKLGDVGVNRGDLVFGDADGVVVIPAAQIAAVVAESEKRDAKEIDIFDQLARGATTIDIYNLPRQDGGKS